MYQRENYNLERERERNLEEPIKNHIEIIIYLCIVR